MIKIQMKLTERTKFVAQFVTVAVVDPDIWRAFRNVESMTAFTMIMPAKDAPFTRTPT